MLTVRFAMFHCQVCKVRKFGLEDDKVFSLKVRHLAEIPEIAIYVFLWLLKCDLLKRMLDLQYLRFLGNLIE